MLLLVEREKIPDCLKNGSGSWRIIQFRVHSVIHTIQIPAVQITTCVYVLCVCIQEKGCVRNTPISRVLESNGSKSWYSLGGKLFKGYKFQTQIYNWSNKTSSKPTYTTSIIVPPGQSCNLIKTRSTKSTTIMKSKKKAPRSFKHMWIFRQGIWKAWGNHVLTNQVTLMRQGCILCSCTCQRMIMSFLGK